MEHHLAQGRSYVASMNFIEAGKCFSLVYKHTGHTPSYIPHLLQLVHAKIFFFCSSLFCCCDLSLRCRQHQQLKLAAAAAWLHCVTSLGLLSQVCSCYCLFIQLLLCIGLSTTAGKQTQHTGPCDPKVIYISRRKSTRVFTRMIPI